MRVVVREVVREDSFWCHKRSALGGRLRERKQGRGASLVVI